MKITLKKCFVKICFILSAQHKFVHMDAYTGTANNAGAILVLGRDLVVVPKLIHPLPPAITSPEASPDHIEDTWMQVTLILLQSSHAPNYLVLLSTS